MRGGRFSRFMGGSGGGGGGSGDSLTAGNILNGVLDCKWNKTSAIPSLLEIYNTSFVKFNIDATTPLVLRFADGWDDNDQPKGVVKKLTAAPSNIDLSGKANCHVQICAKVINGELVITTHDIYDPNVGYTADVLPDFASGYVDVPPFNATNGYLSTKSGWGVWLDSVKDLHYPRLALDSDTGNASYARSTDGNYGSLFLEAPYPFVLGGLAVYGAVDSGKVRIYGYDEIGASWTDLVGSDILYTFSSLVTQLLPNNQTQYAKYKLTSRGTLLAIGSLKFYERPTAKFFRSLNKAKDRTDTECYWINLGYATLDAAGAITALNHYTDLRNNYPGGMRVEA